MKTLWLTSWYPTLLNPFNGDFVQRHAQAVSLYNNVTVLFLERDVHGRITKDIFIKEQTNGNLTERIVYYYSPKNFSFLGKLISFLKYYNLSKKEVKRYLNNGRPHIVHLHVATKAGIIARWVRR